MPTPALLVWARESLGLDPDTASKRIGVKPGQLAAWERGEKRPSIPQLRKIADTYKRPLAAFYLARPPEDVAKPPDFRRRDTAARTPSPALVLAIRQAHAQREAAVDLAAAMGLSVPEFSHALPPVLSNQIAATKLREFVGLTAERQAAWKNSYEALNWWRAAVEDIGILTVQVSKVEPAEMRGFSIFEPRFPVIAINAADAPNGRIFSLVHEFTHVLTRSGGLCAFDDTNLDSAAEIERRCNDIAGQALVPADLLLPLAALCARCKPQSLNSSTLTQSWIRIRRSRRAIHG
jgi:transcriptional regulator with XRE-family HTH domain